MTLEQFQQLLIDCVKYSFGPDKLKRFDGFAMIRSEADLSADVWAKSIIDKDLFHSRRWAAQGYSPSKLLADYPALIGTIYSVSGEKKTCYSMQLKALYPDVDQVGPETNVKDYCKAIRTEEIYPAMTRLINRMLAYIRGTVCATVNGAEVWQYKGILDKMGVAYVVNAQKTAAFQQMFKRKNPTIQGGFIDNKGAASLCGVSRHITFCEDCEVFDFELTEDCCHDWDGQ